MSSVQMDREVGTPPDHEITGNFDRDPDLDLPNDLHGSLPTARSGGDRLSVRTDQAVLLFGAGSRCQATFTPSAAA